jgi:hypothetical protein
LANKVSQVSGNKASQDLASHPSDRNRSSKPHRQRQCLSNSEASQPPVILSEATQAQRDSCAVEGPRVSSTCHQTSRGIFIPKFPALLLSASGQGSFAALRMTKLVYRK